MASSQARRLQRDRRDQQVERQLQLRACDRSAPERFNEGYGKIEVAFQPRAYRQAIAVDTASNPREPILSNSLRLRSAGSFKVTFGKRPLVSWRASRRLLSAISALALRVFPFSAAFTLTRPRAPVGHVLEKELSISRGRSRRR